MSPDPDLTLAPGHDVGRLAEVFARHGRMHLPGLLSSADAQAVGAALAGPTPWHKSMHVGGKSYDFGLDTLDAMPDERRADLDGAFVAGGRTGFQYRFDAWRRPICSICGHASSGSKPAQRSPSATRRWNSD